jgi:hypothetical protein
MPAAAPCLRRRAARASKYAYRARITGLIQTAGPAAALPRLAGAEPADLAETAGRARLWLRWHATGPDSAVFPPLDADLTLSPAGEQTTVLAVAGVYRLPGPGRNRAGPGHGALLRRRDHPQFHRPARLRPNPSGRHSGSGRPHATGTTDAVRLLNAIEVPRQPACPPELTIGPGTCKPPVPPAAPSPPRRPGGRQRSRARGTLAGGVRSRGGVDWLLRESPRQTRSNGPGSAHRAIEIREKRRWGVLFYALPG